MKGVIQRNTVVLIATVAAAVIVAVIILSGGDDDGSEQASAGEAPVAPTTPGGSAAKPEQAAVDTPAEAAAKEKVEDAAATGSEPAEEGDTELTRDQVRQKVKATVPLAERQLFARTAATGVMQPFGYPSVTTRINKRDVVTILIPPADACAVELARIPEVKKKLFEVILFARRIRLQVFGYGGLNGYVRDNCKPLEVPTVPGKVLFSASGPGLKSSDQFQVTADKFTVAYANNSGNLEIYVTRGDQLMEPVIKTEERKTGTQTYAGPGTFRVTVTGSGDWAVKVYDGA